MQSPAGAQWACVSTPPAVSETLLLNYNLVVLCLWVLAHHSRGGVVVTELKQPTQLASASKA